MANEGTGVNCNARHFKSVKLPWTYYFDIRAFQTSYYEFLCSTSWV